MCVPPVQAECDHTLAQGEQAAGQADVNIVRGQGAPLHRGHLGIDQSEASMSGVDHRRVLPGWSGTRS